MWRKVESLICLVTSSGAFLTIYQNKRKISTLRFNNVSVILKCHSKDDDNIDSECFQLIIRGERQRYTLHFQQSNAYGPLVIMTHIIFSNLIFFKAKSANFVSI